MSRPTFKTNDHVKSHAQSHAQNYTTSPAPSQPKPPDASQSGGAGRSAQAPFFTDVVRGEICSIVAGGCMFREAARYVGCTVRAIADLAKRDREFARQVDRALVQRELILLSHIRKAAEQSWKATAWLLEHTVGGRYGRHVMTLEEEVAAEEAEELAAVIGNNHRQPSDTAAAAFAPYQRNVEGDSDKSKSVKGFGIQDPAFDGPDSRGIQNSSSNSAAAVASQDSAFEFEIPGFGKLVPAQPAVASNPQSKSAAPHANVSSAKTTHRSPIATARPSASVNSEPAINSSNLLFNALWVE